MTVIHYISTVYFSCTFNNKTATFNIMLHLFKHLQGDVVNSNLDYAPYIEKGTGVHAKDGDGRKTPWYVPVDEYAGTKRPTFEGKVVIVYGKKGKKFYKTDGMKPRSFLEPARDENKAKVLKVLGGK